MKTILITGASSGIGKETAVLFAQKGWKVAATVRNTEHFNLFADIKNVTPYVLDVKDSDSVKSCIKQAIYDFGKIDVIVNNAGVYTTNPLELTPDETIDDIVETNINGVIRVTKAILKHFRENKSGVIVNVSSVAGRISFPFQSVYHTSKWAVEGFSESLYYELKPLNIKVKVVEPGVVKTNLYRSVQNFPIEQYSDGYRANFKKWRDYQTKSFDKVGYLPELDAKIIYKAVNSKSTKLKYPTDFMGKSLIFMRSLLGLSVFQSIIKKMTIG